MRALPTAACGGHASSGGFGAKMEDASTRSGGFLRYLPYTEVSSVCQPRCTTTPIQTTRDKAEIQQLQRSTRAARTQQAPSAPRAQQLAEGGHPPRLRVASGRRVGIGVTPALSERARRLLRGAAPSAPHRRRREPASRGDTLSRCGMRQYVGFAANENERVEATCSPAGLAGGCGERADRARAGRRASRLPGRHRHMAVAAGIAIRSQGAPARPTALDGLDYTHARCGESIQPRPRRWPRRRVARGRATQL